MIEFLVSILVLVTLVMGCIGLTMALYTYEVINQYARDASRFAIVHGNGCSYSVKGVATSCSIGTGSAANTALQNFLNTEIFPGINGANLSVTTTYTYAPGLTSCFATNCNGAGDQVTVKVAYPYLYIVPFIPQNSFTMNGYSTMVISQ